MLKKLLVLIIVGFTSSFVSAEEKEVTDSYLLGMWNCINAHLSASSNGDDDFNYDYKVTDDPIIITFLKPDDYDGYQPKDGEIKQISKPEYIKKDKYNRTYNKDTQGENYNTTENGYTYVNKNEFIFYQNSAILLEIQIQILRS